MLVKGPLVVLNRLPMTHFLLGEMESQGVDSIGKLKSRV